MQIIEKFRKSAKEKNKTIVLPEGGDERVIRAAAFLAKEKIVNPVLLGDRDNIHALAKSINVGLNTVEIVDPKKSPHLDNWSLEYYELRKHKNISKEEAWKTMQDPLFFGAFMVRKRNADGGVAGSINTTGNVLRAGIQVIGLADKVSAVSSSFLMALKQGRVITFADCAVIPEPDAPQLASIALSSALTHQRLTGEEPRVAMLSFSTKGSATHTKTEKVVTATQLLKNLNPDLKADGELQFDAAYIESVGKRKAPDSDVAGYANVFIFPDLDAGNIGYKIAQRLGEAEAIGPIIQGLKHPFNDLSRGCSVEDVINVSCICAIIS